MIRSRDTTPDAEAMQLELLRRMAPERKLQLVYEMTMAARELTLAGIRSRHPEYTDEEAKYALFRTLVGDELFRRAWPDAPILAP